MPRLWPAALGLLAALFATFQFGYLCSRSRLGELEADLYNARQREERIAGRLNELEARLGGKAFVRAEHAASTETEAKPEPENATRGLEETVSRLEGEKRAAERALEAAKRDEQTAERARRELAAEKTRLEGELARLRERVATLQAKAPKPQTPSTAASMPPAKASRPSSEACPTLERAEFALLETSSPLTRFGGRLRLEVEPQGADLVLRVGGSRYLLETPPQRFSFDCAGTAYVVSVCELTREPLAVAGRITPADAWQDACRR